MRQLRDELDGLTDMPRLSAVPDSPPRAIAYIRVSTAREDMVSPELQMTAIEDHCARMGYRLIETIQDLDLSGRFWNRRQVDRAIGMIESGDADALVVWKWSRVSRNRLDWAVAVDRVESAGGRLDSATEAIDTSTSTGRFTRGMLAEMAAFESDRIGDGWKEAHARRTKAGLPANGKARFGYVNVEGLHRPDPDTGPVLADLYRRYIAGESLYSLVVWLNARGIHTVAGYSKRGGGPWSLNGIRQMLDSGFGAGFITVHASRQPGAHEPVIDSGTWTAYQAARALRRPLKRAERSPYLLSSMVWCVCGSKMGHGKFGANTTRGLRCLISTRPGAERHPGAYAPLLPVEQAVYDWLARESTDAKRATDAALARRAKSVRRRQDAKTLARQVLELDQAIGRVVADQGRRPIPDAAYRAGLDELSREREQLEERRVIAEAESADGPPREIAANLIANWDTYDLEQLRAGLRKLEIRVVVDATVRPVKVDVTTDWTGDNSP